MVFNIYVSNKIGAEAVGVFSLIMSIYMFFITIATSGLSLACTCIVSEQFAKGNFLDGLKAVRSCILFSLCLGICSGSILTIFSKIIVSSWLDSSISAIPLYLIAIGLPFIAISSSVNGYFSAVGKAYKSAVCQFLELIIKIICTVFLLQVGNSKSLEYICICLILADVISEICSCIFIYIFYRIDRIRFYKRHISIITFKKKILKITLPVSITSYIRSGLSTLKQFIIPNRLTLFGYSYSTALAEYGKINGMTLPVLMFPNVAISSFSSLLIPEYSRLLANEYKKRIVYVCDKIFMITSMFSICVAYVFLFFSNELSLAIFQNIECGIYMRMLSPLILLMYLDNIIDSMLKGLNKQFGVMVCNILDLVITISILYFLLPIFGIGGYIFSICVSEIFNFLVSYIQLYKATGFKLNLVSSIVKPILCGLVSMAILIIISILIPIHIENFLLCLIVKITIFVVFYILCHVGVSQWYKRPRGTL